MSSERGHRTIGADRAAQLDRTARTVGAVMGSMLPARAIGMAAVLALALAGLGWRAHFMAQPVDATPLAAGCTNVALAYRIGTPLQTVAAAVQPTGVLNGIFRYDPVLQRFVGFSPTAPAAANDYPAITALPEAVFVCTIAPATIVRSGGGIVAQPPPPPSVSLGIGVISAPREVQHGQSVTMILGATPGIVCTGGVNIPSGGTFRFVPISTIASPSGTIFVQFDVVEADDRGFGYLAVRCADGLVIRVDFRVL